MFSDDVMIMSVFGCDGGGGDDASLCKAEMECSSHCHLLVFGSLLYNFNS